MNMLKRRALILLFAMLIPAVVDAGEVKFSLDLDGYKWKPNQDVRTRARLAE